VSVAMNGNSALASGPPVLPIDKDFIATDAGHNQVEQRARVGSQF